MKAVVVAAMTFAVALAGCAEGEADPTPPGALSGGVDQQQFKLEAGTGAIAGLLVDDRFRPIDLEDEPETEFQAPGFVLVQETGHRAQTDENGQFAVVDLAPGTYTLRATIAGHEASPVKVTVQEALFAEATMVARRVSTAGATILTQEYTVFVPCAIQTPENVYIGNCYDTSAQQDRRGLSGVNWTAFNTSYVVVEALMDNPEAAWAIQVREDDGSSGGGDRYVRMDADTATGYARAVMMRSDEEVYDEATNPSPWNNTKLVAVLPFPQKGAVPTGGYGDPNAIPGGREPQCETINGVTPPGTTDLNCAHPLWAGGGAVTRDTGLIVASRGQFLVSLFLGEPDVDIESYQLMNP